MNKIVICGRLTKDPELRTTNNGTEAVSYTHLDVYKRQSPASRTFGREPGNIHRIELPKHRSVQSEWLPNAWLPR